MSTTVINLPVQDVELFVSLIPNIDVCPFCIKEDAGEPHAPSCEFGIALKRYQTAPRYQKLL